MTLGDSIAQTTADLSGGMSRLDSGICVGINWTTYSASVNVSGGTVDMPMAGVLPSVGDKVWIGFLGNQPICLGPVPKPTTGTVTGSPTLGKVTVKGDDGVTYSVAYDASYTPASGHRVALDWSVPGGVIPARLSSDAALLVPPTPPPPPASSLQEATFNPNDSGSFNGSWFTSQVWCSDTTQGAWFYGGAIASTIPDGASIESISIYVDAVQTQGASPTLGLHGLGAKSGNPGVSSAVGIAGGSGWKALPISFGDALKTGSKLGIGTLHGGYHKWSPAGTRNSGALNIKWRS